MTLKLNVTANVLLVSAAIIVCHLFTRGISISGNTKLYLGYPGDSVLNFTEITSKYGYISEEHKVVTEDGYILTIFRMTKEKNCLGKLHKPPVILMHGLLQSSDVWVDAGPHAGLAYLLSDACYELWVCNQRGNYYARRHIRLNPDRDAEFWDFSVDEIGLYDIPATINYVMEYSNAPKVNYIGFSQGTSTFLVMCSEKPSYCDKVNLMIGLSPAARQVYTRSVPYRRICELAMYVEAVLRKSGFQEILPRESIGQELLEFVCQFKVLSEPVCGTVKSLFDSYHPDSITNDTLRVLFSHFPAGTSLKNIVRYAQSFKSYNFQKFDYGKGNLERYGAVHPPAYNLSAVTVPFVTIYGKNDYLVDPRDVSWLNKQLPNLIEAIEVADPLWNHFDTTYSKFSNEMIFPKVNHYLEKYSTSDYASK